MAKFFISTPIYYTNDVAHIGHAYTTIAADVLARYHRQQGKQVLFSTGTDENSLKVVKSAEVVKKEPQGFVDEMAVRWRQTWDQLEISYDRFVRTTEPDHKAATYALFEKINASGDLYKGMYEGLYCEGCEEFKKDSDLEEGLCPLHKTTPKSVKEENYFFKLSKYQQPLLKHIREHDEFVQPESRRHEVMAFVERGLDDISVTREGQQWGIPYPFDEKHVIYVWAEALINYLTVTGYPDNGYEKWWPADVHMIGKDILKFHAVIWPAMLLSAGLPLPKTVFGHGFWNADGHKMSKSLGNVINPLKVVQAYGTDAFRYLLLRDTPFGEDGDWQTKRVDDVYNSDLADDLGNLIQRTITMINKYQDGAIGEIPNHSHDIKPFKTAMENFRFDKALEEIWVLIRGLNQYIEEEKPWIIAKDDPAHLKEVLAYLAGNILQVGQLLQPFMPHVAEEIDNLFKDGLVRQKTVILFPKRESKTSE